MPSSPSRPAAAAEVSDAEMSDGEVPPRHAAESLGGGAANRAAPGSAGEEDEEIYDDDRSSDDRDYSYDDDDSDESGWYYEDHEEEEGAGWDRPSGSAEEEAASAGVGGGPKGEGSPRAAATCCICMDPWASYGAHRICCIPCGHVYGRSCLERWLLRGGNTSAKCPQCGQRFKHRHIINLYSTVHLWNDCCYKEIRAQSMSSTSSVHPRPHAISFRMAQLEARIEEESRLREEAMRRQEERMSAQNQFFEERMAVQSQAFDERMSQAINESRAAQNQFIEERLAAQNQFFEERMATLSLAFKERLAGQSQAIESPYALHGKSSPSMPSLPPPRAPHTHAYFRYLNLYRQECAEHDAKRTCLQDYRGQQIQNMYLAMENGTRAPPMGPPPPNPGPAPVMLTIVEFLARGGDGTPGSHGSNVGGGSSAPGDGTLASRSPVTLVHNLGGDAGGGSTSTRGSPLF